MLLFALALTQNPGALDTTFTRWRAGPPIPAVAMAVVHHGKVIYTNVAGFADLEHRVPATLQTRFDWASIAKQFTAFAISLQVEQGRLAPSDPVRRFLPELDLDGGTITVEQLIHHTAGLEDADGLMTLAGGRPGDAVATADVVRLLLAQQHLRFAPGEQQSYGNGGYALLTEIVARVSGTTFEAWCDSAIFKPLGLASTSFLASGDLIPDHALPYVLTAGAYRPSTIEAYSGAGGLQASVGDLARWTMHLMQPVYQPAATRRLRERGHLTSGESIDYAWGLGWGTYRGVPTLSHAGSGPATSAQMRVFPEQEFAVVVAAAADLAPDVNTLANRAADLFLANVLGPRAAAGGPQMMMLSLESVNAEPAESRGIVVPEDRLRAYAGTYRFADDGPALIIRPRRGRLEFAYDGQPPYLPLFPLPDGRFVMVPLWDAYRFTLDASGAVNGLARERTPRSMRRRGDSVVVAARMLLPRLDSAAAAPYLGTYYSDELRTFYEVVFDGSSLALRHARHGSMSLLPLGGEEFGIDSRSVTRATFGRVGNDVVGMELRAYSWDARASFRRVPSAQPSTRPSA